MNNSSAPNIVFLFSDQHNARVLGHHGHPHVQTPNFDRLAAEGVSFENAVCQNPICTPSRICYATGQYPHNHGFYHTVGGSDVRIPNVMEHFRRNGYTTIATGKFHFPGRYFEETVEHTVRLDEKNNAHDLWLEERGRRALKDSIRYPEDDTEVGTCSQSCDGRPSNLEFEEGMDYYATSRALEFLEAAHAKGGPFFAAIHWGKPHQIYSPARQFWDLYDADSLTLPPNTDYDPLKAGKAPHFVDQVNWWKSARWPLFEPRTFEAARRRKLHGYLGCVSEIDALAGRVLAWLDEHDLAENTIVVYASDHGDYAGEHDIMEKSPGLSSRAITQIPFIWRWPGRFRAGHRPTQIVESVDWSATLCALCGIEPLLTSDGRDLTPILEGGDAPVREFGITENLWSKCLQNDRYRYIRYPRAMFSDTHPDGFGELYDLQEDPWEMRNLYFDRGYESVVRDLDRQLMDWLITSTRPHTAQNIGFSLPESQRIVTSHGYPVLPDERVPTADKGFWGRKVPHSPNPAINYL